MNFKSTTYVLLIAIALTLSACNSENPFDLDNVIAALPADTLLSISTYDGSGQAVHPDIILSNNIFYLAITPYPFSNDSYENPCLYSSIDGLEFNPCVSNPLVKTPKNGHNSDPDIFIDNSGILNICYRESISNDADNIILLKNKGNLRFRSSTILHYPIIDPKNRVLSPSITYYQDQYYLFYMRKYEIKYLTSSNLDSLDKTNEHDINIHMPENYRCWHVDVFKAQDTDEYYMLLHGYLGAYNYSLTFATSTDLTNWTVQGEIINNDNLTDEEAWYVYRSTGIVNNNILVIWYSYRTYNNYWKLGLKKIDINTLS